MYSMDVDSIDYKSRCELNIIGNENIKEGSIVLFIIMQNIHPKIASNYHSINKEGYEFII